jgi:tetratricopeptide (TPR) repeat protein
VACAYAQSGKYQKAVKEYKIAIEIAPYEDEILYMSLGSVLSELGEYKAALQYYEIALEINPFNERVASNLAIIKMNAGMR